MHNASCVPCGDYITVGVGSGDWSRQSRHEAKTVYFPYDLCLYHLYPLSWNVGPLFCIIIIIILFCCIVFINMVIVASEMTQRIKVLATS